MALRHMLLITLVAITPVLPAHAAPAATERAAHDALARDVARTESLRAVKDLQRSYAHYVQFGLWREAASLFADTGTARFERETARGPRAIAALIASRFGGGREGLRPGALNTELIDQPVVNLSIDGESATARWNGIRFHGDGVAAAGIDGGLYDNDYVRERGVWKIAALNFDPQFAGPYETGWTNWGGGDLPVVRYRFDADKAGVPIPPPADPAPRSRATPADVQRRVAALADEDAVRSLQHAYGYYVDRRMWDDVADLFAADGAIEIAGIGVYRGAGGVRRALATMGPAGLTHGVLNDHPQFDMIVRILPGGAEAEVRGIEIGMLGDADSGRATWRISVFRNRFVKDAGRWKLREVRLFPVLTADYAKGWSRGRIAPPQPAAAQAPDQRAAGTRDGTVTIPAFLGPNPVTGRAVAAPRGMTIVDVAPLTGAIAVARGAATGDAAAARAALARVAAFDGTENVSSAYGFFIDDFQWPQMTALFAEKGNKQTPFAGYYFGRERIMGAVTTQWGAPAATRPGISYHWRTQPVILVARDGRSANLRTRLFQPRTGKGDPAKGGFYTASFNGGMYPNDQAVLENGIWRLWSLTIDEPYFASRTWAEGWSGAKPRAAGSAAPPSPLLSKYPPDIPITALGRREEGFRGGTGTTIDWPGILPMWFNYRNPVSGRVPSNYWPDCVPCEMAPETSMTRNGYLMPPTGPRR